MVFKTESFTILTLWAASNYYKYFKEVFSVLQQIDSSAAVHINEAKLLFNENSLVPKLLQTQIIDFYHKLWSNLKVKILHYLIQ